MIILASTSKRRQELLKKLTNDFQIMPPQINENINAKDAASLVLMLSLLKAENILVKTTRPVIGADTVVALSKTIFGKPKDYNEAFDTLKKLSGKIHTVFTGICVALKNIRLLAFEKTQVEFNNLNDGDIKRYLTKFKPYDKAGSYGVQDNFPLIKKIEGDYDNVLGLPVAALFNLLKKLEKVTEEKWLI